MDNTIIKIETFVSTVLILNEVENDGFAVYLKDLQVYLEHPNSFTKVLTIIQILSIIL